jgi:hypothetical protein
VVEHVDEGQYHLHFYIVPELRADSRLNVPEIHPGFRAKSAAKAAGNSKKDQDAAYRSGMSRWQDDYWWNVSRHFSHARLGPKRTRLRRREYLHRKRMEAERIQHQAEIEATRRQAERQAAERRVEQDREYARRLAVIQKCDANFTASFAKVTAVVNEERQRRRAAEEEVQRLRARLAVLEPEEPMSTLQI